MLQPQANTHDVRTISSAAMGNNSPWRFHWRHLLAVLPVTALLTLIITLAACFGYYTSDNNDGLPQISQLGARGTGHTIFAAGFFILAIQMTALFVAWWSIVRAYSRAGSFTSAVSILNYVSLVCGCLGIICCLVMAFNSVDTAESIHLAGAFGTFGLLIGYELLTMALLITHRCRRGEAYVDIGVTNQAELQLLDGNYAVVFSVFAVVCVLVGGICSAVWTSNSDATCEWTAAFCPFAFFAGMVPILFAAGTIAGEVAERQGRKEGAYTTLH